MGADKLASYPTPPSTAFLAVTVFFAVAALLTGPLLAAAAPATPGRGIATVTDSVASRPASLADLQVLKRRLYEADLGNGSAGAIAGLDRNARRFMQTLSPDGSWPDVDYTDQARSNWKSAQHLNRLSVMVRTLRIPGQPLYGDPALKADIHLALDYWISHNFQNPNWWHNLIGVPQQLSPILLLMDPDLTPEERAGGGRILHRSDIGDRGGKPKGIWTGANLVWMASNQVVRGCLENNPAVIAEALAAIYGEISIVPGHEGIQTDYSFHQHGPLLYSGGYGQVFTDDCARWAGLTTGTGFAMPAARLNLLERYVLDGQRWLTRGRVYDYGCVGRELTRPGKDARGLIPALETLAQLPGPRQQAFDAFARQLSGDTKAAAPVGNRQFWKSDIMVQRRPGYYTSARMFSTRTLNTDGFINGENKKSHHLADGDTYLFRTGEEYRDIFPVWDWQKIPGTTAEQSAEPMDPHKVSEKGLGSFVGGVSDGTYGLAAMDLQRAGLGAHKAWFYFDEEFACLGAGIHGESDNPVATTVNQCLLHGAVSTASQEEPLPAGDHVLSGDRWVLQDGVGYYFPGPASELPHIHVGNKAQEGSWAEIGVGSSDKLSKDVFSLWIDHGAHPTAASYEYIVIPDANRNTLTGTSDKDRVEILSNTPSLQAVRHNGLRVLEAAFFSAGTLNGGKGWTVGVDRPCLLLLKETPEGLEVAVSNPENQALDVNVTIDRRLSGEGCEDTPEGVRVAFSLPGGESAGQSVVRMLRAK